MRPLSTAANSPQVESLPSSLSPPFSFLGKKLSHLRPLFAPRSPLPLSPPLTPHLSHPFLLCPSCLPYLSPCLHLPHPPILHSANPPPPPTSPASPPLSSRLATPPPLFSQLISTSFIRPPHTLSPASSLNSSPPSSAPPPRLTPSSIHYNPPAHLPPPLPPDPPIPTTPFTPLSKPPLPPPPLPPLTFSTSLPLSVLPNSPSSLPPPSPHHLLLLSSFLPIFSPSPSLPPSSPLHLRSASSICWSFCSGPLNSFSWCSLPGHGAVRDFLPAMYSFVLSRLSYLLVFPIFSLFFVPFWRRRVDPRVGLAVYSFHR